MTCRHVAQLQDVYLDGELSASLTAEVHAHLLQCPACQQQFEMFRACGEVVAKDRSEPMLDSGFAMRVVAALPRTQPASGPVALQTRRGQRRRFWRLVLGSSVPAAAAVLFFAILIWPTHESARPTGLVAGARHEATDFTGLEDVARPTLDALDNATRAASSISRIGRLWVDEARRGVDATTRGPGDPNKALFDILLDHLREFLQPIEEEPAPSSENGEIVRF